MLSSDINKLFAIKDKRPSKTTSSDYKERRRLSINLFGTYSLHDAFSRCFPEMCIATVLWVSPGERVRVYPHEKNLNMCLRKGKKRYHGIYIYFKKHSNLLWINPEDLSIYRFDPQFPSTHKDSLLIDDALQDFLSELLPNYTYYGNTLEEIECPQRVREMDRGYLDCFCQEYTLLYAIRRINGMTHQEAAYDITCNLARIEDEILDLYTLLQI